MLEHPPGRGGEEDGVEYPGFRQTQEQPPTTLIGGTQRQAFHSAAWQNNRQHAWAKHPFHELPG